ncbi:Metallo-dependent phosphatase [Mytilinidion resinicola]|uniref:Metallo-dependent phosphatase n=1 Tax=Mytilinidion resinicola TaxID=574789 RepID=A0A6A6Z738_9PEZI|nr:Metallo-dependent phosphatase [Mytilinidion resinicola]KAF2816628.1 Metallo-dependent phosphatase [Mytilinidion resinicola]
MTFQQSSLLQKPTTFQQFIWSPLKYTAQCLYRLLSSTRLRLTPLKPPIRVVCVSDTHNGTPNVPEGDLLIHAGDLTNTGTLKELQAQIIWFSALPHRHKIVVAGNHDTFLDPSSRPTLALEDREGKIDWQGVMYLQCTSTTLAFPDQGRQLKVYGSPLVPLCGGSSFAFQYPRHLDSWTAEIPTDIDILVTHTPPRYHRDISSGSVSASGCAGLLKAIWRIRPLLHVCGHVHANRGTSVLDWDRDQAAYERACGRRMAGFGEILSWRAWKDFVVVLMFGVTKAVTDRIWNSASQASILVNAAMWYDKYGNAENEIQVVLV